MSEPSISIRPLTGALGAEIDGVDLGQMNDDAFSAIHRALLAHQVIVFHDQDLSIEAQKAFASRFGPLFVHPYLNALPDHPEVVEIVKQPGPQKNFGGSWHADLTYLERPMLGAVLYALDAPPHGGDTLFASMYAAWEALSPGLRGMLSGLKAVHDDGRTGYFQQERVGAMTVREETLDGAVGTAFAHPVVHSHPETGRAALLVSELVTTHFQGMTAEESRPLLRFLFDHLQRPEFTCRVRWKTGTVVVWDNRCTQHLAINDYPDFRRAMRRILIAGERPRRAGAA